MSSGGQAPIDTNVVIPRGVKAASERSEAIHKQAYSTGEAAPPQNGATPPPVAATPPPAPSPPAPPPVAATPPQPPPAPVPPPETAEDWKHRYTSLKGRFDQQAGQLANANTRLTSLETLVAGLQAPRQPAPQPAPQRRTKRLTDEDVKEYGEDLIKVVQKAALDVVEPVLDQRVTGLRTEVQGKIDTVAAKATSAERESANSAHQRLLDYLDKNLNTWRQINHHPKFHTWLSLTDPLSGAIRKNLLNDAVARGDASRALTFYKAFLAEEGVPAPANGNGQLQPPPTPPAGNGNGTGIDLASLAAPGRPAASGTAPTAPDSGSGEIITRAQISTFYANKNRGMYSPEEAARLEAEVFKAGREGRVR